MTYSVNALFTRSLNDSDSRFLLAMPNVLFNDTEKVWMQFIREYIDDHRVIPSLGRFIIEFPSFRSEEVEARVPIKDIFQVVVPEAQKTYLYTKMAQDFAKGKGDWNPEYFSQLIADVTPTSTDILELTKLTRNELVKSRKLFPWGEQAKWMQNMIGKLDHKDYVIIAGKAKSAKTTLLSILAVSLFKQGNNLLIFNNELDKHFMASKIISILKSFNPNVFRTMEFTPEIEEKLTEFEEEMQYHENQIYIYGRITTPADIISAYNNCKVKPDIILIDAFNNMGGKSATNQSDKSVSLGNMAKFCRDFINDFGIPIICTCQLNRTQNDSLTPGQDAIGDTIEIIRQADHVLTTTNKDVDPDEIKSPIAQRFKAKYPNTKMPFYFVNTMLSRHAGSGAYSLHIEWDSMKMIVAESSLMVRQDLMEKEILEQILYERNEKNLEKETVVDDALVSG